MVWRVDPDAGAGPGLAYFPVGTCGGCTATDGGGGAGIGTSGPRPSQAVEAVHPCTKSVPCGPPSQLATAAVHLIFSRAALATAMACSACLDSTVL